MGVGEQVPGAPGWGKGDGDEMTGPRLGYMFVLSEEKQREMWGASMDLRRG